MRFCLEQKNRSPECRAIDERRMKEECPAGFDFLLAGRDNMRCCAYRNAGVTQLVECNLAKVDVAGSNPVSRSKDLLMLDVPLAGGQG